MAEGRGEKRRLILVAGEMLELGPDEAQLHRQAGIDIAKAGVDVLWGIRGFAKEIVAGAVSGGLSVTRFFESSTEAAIAIIDEACEGDLILVKGSRGVATEKVVSSLKEHFALTGEDNNG
jgi:UDP-N-acetylmuramoyl-tripeptide--D-alanyl-D-alanine ligase